MFALGIGTMPAGGMYRPIVRLAGEIWASPETFPTEREALAAARIVLERIEAGAATLLGKAGYALQEE